MITALIASPSVVPLPAAIQSVVPPTSPGTDTILSIINGQVGFLQMMSGIFFGVTTFMFLVLGFLLWRNDQLKKQAEKNADAIKKMYQDTANIMNQSKAMIENLQEQVKVQLENSIKNAKQIEDGAAKIKTKTKEAEELSYQALQIKNNLNNSLISLSTISGTIPPFPNVTTVVSGNLNDYSRVPAMYAQGSVPANPLKPVEVDLHNTPKISNY
jgi:hypothetical protein